MHWQSFPEFLTCSKASIGTNGGKIEKSSENSVDSSGGKLSKGESLKLVWLSVLSTVSFDRSLQLVKLCLRGVASVRISIINFVPVVRVRVECFDSGEKRKQKSSSEVLCDLKLATITCCIRILLIYKAYFSTRSFFDPC